MNMHENNGHFLSKNDEKYRIFLPPLQQKSRSLRSIDRFKIFTGYIWEMCKTPVVCFKLLALMVLEINSAQISGFSKNMPKNFASLNRPYDRYAWSRGLIILWKVHKSQIRKLFTLLGFFSSIFYLY